MSDGRLDLEQAIEFTRHVFGFLSGSVVSAMIYLGDGLGLYKAMQGAGPLSAAELASRTGLHERWVLEWLRAQGAAGLVAYHGEDRFELTDVQAAVLADEQDSLFFSAGGFGGLPQRMRIVERLPESFRTGVGLTFDEFGAEGNHAVARMFAPWFRHMLVPVILPALEGVTAKLEAGAKVADVGCGGGVALIAMAEAYPASEFHGYDISEHALALARRNLDASDASNVAFHDVRAEALPPGAGFDLVTMFDCVHDMTDPAGALRAAREAIASDGTLLIADINGRPTFEENVADIPMAAMMYGFSVLSCMSSALSEPGGAGLGTLGFHEQVARRMTEEAGFTRFTAHDLGNPLNNYYEVRP